MASYDTYLLATVLPPLIIVVTILLTTYCLWGVTYFIFTLKKRRNEQNAFIEYPGLQYMYMALQAVFGTKLLAKRTHNRVKLKFYGQEIGPGVVPPLVQLVALALGLSLAVFLTVLTVDIGHVCDERLDCFPFNYSRKARPLNVEPIQNCSMYKSSGISVTCYHFTIRFVEALGSSGGVLALTTLGINFYLALLFMLARAQCCRKTGLCGCVLLFLMICYILLSTLLWLLPLGLTQSKMLAYVTNWESVLIYYYTSMYLLLVATLLPCCVSRYRQDFGSYWSREQRRYRAPQTHESDSEEEITPSTSLRSQQRSTGYYATFDRSGGASRPAGYCEERLPNPSLTDQANKTSTVAQPSESESEANQSSSTITSGDTNGSVAEKSPTAYHKQSVHGQHSTKRITSKKARKRARARGEVRERRRGNHWTEAPAQIDEGQGYKIDTAESSAESVQDEHDKQEGEGGGRTDKRVMVVGSSQIRAVLTGGAVDHGERKGAASVHTHL